MEQTENQENNTQEDVFQENTLTKNTKPGLYIIIALVTIVFASLLLWVVFGYFGGTTDDELIVTPSSEQRLFVNPDDVVGRDSEILGLRIDTIVGKFFTHPETRKTLYVKEGEECTGECLDLFEPLLAEGKYDNDEGLTAIKRTDKLGYQYAWNGQALYTFKEDNEGGVLADGYPGGWRIARP
jgi:hypothetical protein